MVVQPQRKSAEERRDEILDAALEEFAERGLHGASTEAIAKRAGISQPYVFRLFGSKKDLFKASVARCLRETLELFQRAAEGKRGQEALAAMGDAYQELLVDRTRLRAQMQAYAACDDPGVRDTVRRCYEHLHREAADMSGADAEQIRNWFSTGMFLNVMAAMDAPSVKGAWIQELMGDLMLEKLKR